MEADDTFYGIATVYVRARPHVIEAEVAIMAKPLATTDGRAVPGIAYQNSRRRVWGGNDQIWSAAEGELRLRDNNQNFNKYSMDMQTHLFLFLTRPVFF